MHKDEEMKDGNLFGHGAIIHSHSQRSVLEVFLLDQSDIFILNWPISDVSNCNPLVKDNRKEFNFKSK